MRNKKEIYVGAYIKINKCLKIVKKNHFLFCFYFNISWSGLSLQHDSLCRICGRCRSLVEEGVQGGTFASSSPSLQLHAQIYSPLLFSLLSLRLIPSAHDHLRLPPMSQCRFPPLSCRVCMYLCSGDTDGLLLQYAFQ